jgi:thioredoxin reductase (NADPH)
MEARQRDAADSPAPVGEVINTDAVVIGAGPVGLFQVFELGLQDIRAHVIDALPQAGGQPSLLYPDKPSYDVPGRPVCSGAELTDALMRQCAPFAPEFHLKQTVTGLERQADERFLVTTSAGVELLAKTVFIAAGVGAFEPRRLKLSGLEVFEGSQLYHHAREAGPQAKKHVLVIGDEDEAIECALKLSTAFDGPASVTLMHRRDSFRADPDRIARMRQRCQEGALKFVTGQLTGFDTKDGRLTKARITTSDGSEQMMALDTLLVLQGLSPRLGPVAEWGLAMERKQVIVDTEHFATSEPGIFAVGDINSYPGKRKLLVCGFHECTLAAYAAAALIYPERPVQLQYTTTSPHLHHLLGVAPHASP